MRKPKDTETTLLSDNLYMGKVKKTKKHRNIGKKITRNKRRHLKTFKRSSKNKSRKTRRGGQKRKRISGGGKKSWFWFWPFATTEDAVPESEEVIPPSFLNISGNKGYAGQNALLPLPPKRMASVDASEKPHMQSFIPSLSGDTYVIHAHGRAKQKMPKYDIPQNVKIFSPISCFVGLTYNAAQGHNDSLKMIASSCPGKRGEGEQYVLTYWDDIYNIEFIGERSDAAHTPDVIEGADGEYIKFVAGVYKCIGENRFEPKPVIRIARRTPILLSQIVTTLLLTLPPGKIITIIISSCLGYSK